MPPVCHPYVKRPKIAPTTTWGPTGICAEYDWPVKTATGRGVIAIVELGGGWVADDIKTFCADNGVPMPAITDVSVDGTNNSPGQSDADVEVALDIECAAASFFMATGKPAKIHVYWAQDIASAVAAATKDGCAVCSISWGADESSWSRADADAMQAAVLAANAAGMVVFAAAGDNDSSDGGGATGVDCPGSCPNVVCCGGTSRAKDGVETVWNDTPNNANGEGTGGGYSTLFAMPEWQSDNGAPPAPKGLGRMVPDVTGNADPETGFRIFVGGAEVVVGGTSAVAPLYAGLFAALGAKLGDVGPDIWAHQTDFRDITKGENGVYSAKVGPDACSGVGVAIGTKVAALFSDAA